MPVSCERGYDSFVLASASPRRRALLGALVPKLCVMVPEADESVRDDEAPAALVRRLSQLKAQAVQQRLDAENATMLGGEHACIIAADTVVVAPGDAGEILGKPNNEAQACQMLRRLRGREHHVFTGLAMLELDGRRRSQVMAVETPVLMRAYSDEQVATYVASGDPLDKAGAYAIQHAQFAPVARFDGCYANVMGLPLCHLYCVLTSWGYAFDRHPLEGCPYPREHAGQCPWAGSILTRPN